jgi:DNA-binding CsgD family transcriptional regulator
MNQAFYARGRLRKAQQRFEDALADFREQGARDARCHSRNPNLPWRLDAADCLVALGRDEEARGLVEEQLAAAQRYGARSAIGAALHGQAKLESGPSRIEALERAVTELAASPARLVHANALFDLGVSLRAAGRRNEATARLRAALQLAHTCGATMLQRSAHEELLVLGARPRRLMFSGIESLTASERRVAKMAANGLTNRQIAQALFVTLKTVEHHLSNTYRKLDITSRDELPEALGADGSEDVQLVAS